MKSRIYRDNDKMRPETSTKSPKNNLQSNKYNNKQIASQIKKNNTSRLKGSPYRRNP